MRVCGLERQWYELCRYGLVELSSQGRDRLRALTLWRETGDVALACRTKPRPQGIW